MTNARRRVSALAAAALAVSVLAGCSDDSTGSPDSSEPSTSSPSQNPTSSEPPSDFELAEQAAVQVVRDYFATVDRLRQEPNRPMKELSKVAISGHLAAQEILIGRERARGLHQIGSTQIVDLRVESINLDNSDPAAGKIPIALVDVCWDVSDADLLDKSGSSVVSPSRPGTGWTRYTVANYRWDKDPQGSWRVSNGQDLKRTPCPPA